MKKTLTILFLLIANGAFAEEAKVFCSTESGKWKWLKEDNSIFNKTKIEGEFVDQLDQYLILKKYFTYFKISPNENKVEQLIQACIYSYGKDYKYAQVSKGLTSDWYLIGLSDEFIFPGHYRIYKMLGNAADSMEVEKRFTSKMLSVESAFK